MTRDIVEGDYLARYADCPDDGRGRCGFSELELAVMQVCLVQRGLRLVADDIGLKVVRPVVIFDAARISLRR